MRTRWPWSLLLAGCADGVFLVFLAPFELADTLSEPPTVRLLHFDAILRGREPVYNYVLKEVGSYSDWA